MIKILRSAAKIRRQMVALPEKIKSMESTLDQTDEMLEEIEEQLTLNGEKNWFSEQFEKRAPNTGFTATCDCVLSRKPETSHG